MTDEMPITAEVEGAIERFIVTEVLGEPEEVKLPADTTLISGLLDSFGLMQLLSFLEERYSIRIRNNEVVKRNFNSVAELARFVRNKQQDGDGQMGTSQAGPA